MHVCLYACAALFDRTVHDGVGVENWQHIEHATIASTFWTCLLNLMDRLLKKIK